MNNHEKISNSPPRLDQKEGRFHGGIQFRSEELGVDVALSEGKRLLASIVLDADGTPKIKKGIYDSSKIPQKIDPANFDYDDNAMAEYYDSNPEISIINIDPAKADELLAQRQHELEESLKEVEAQKQEAEDEIEAEKNEMAHSPIEHDLEQVKAFRAKLKLE
jgi:hypothetical protein